MLNNIECLKTLFRWFGGSDAGVVIVMIIFITFLIGLVHSIKSAAKIKKITKELQNFIRKSDTPIELLQQSSKGLSKRAKLFWDDIIASCVTSQNRFGNEEIIFTGNLHAASQNIKSENKVYGIIPSLLTGLGLFGTFLGLTQGLSGLQTNTQNSDELMEGIQKIIEGASAAFSTSLWGIGASLAIMFIEKQFAHSSEKRIKRLNALILSKFSQFNYEQNVLSMKDSNFFIKENIATLAEQIGNKMQEGISIATEEMTKNISEAVNKLVETTQNWGTKVASGSEVVLNNIVSEFIDKVGSSAAEQAKLMDNSTEKMNLVIGNLDKILSNNAQLTNNSLEKMQEMQKKSFAAYSSEIENVSNQFIQNQEKQQQVFENIATTCQNAAEMMSQEMNNFKENLKDSTIVLKTQMNHFEKSCSLFSKSLESLSGSVEDFKEISDTITDITEQSELIYTKIEKLSDSLANTYNGAEEMVNIANSMLSGLNNSFDEVNKEQRQLFKELQEAVEALENQVTSTFNSFTENIVQQTDERLRTWNEQTNQYSQNMLSIVAAMRELIDEMEQRSSKRENN